MGQCRAFAVDRAIAGCDFRAIDGNWLLLKSLMRLPTSSMMSAPAAVSQ
jgi:hypothetical protein